MVKAVLSFLLLLLLIFVELNLHATTPEDNGRGYLRPFICEQDEYLREDGRQYVLSMLMGLKDLGEGYLNRPLKIKAEDEVDDWMACYSTPESLKNYEQSKAALRKIEKVFGVPYAFTACKIWQETHWAGNLVSPEGARGLSQMVQAQVTTLSNTLNFARNPPKELSKYRELIVSRNQALAEVRALEKSSADKRAITKYETLIENYQAFIEHYKGEEKQLASLCAAKRLCMEGKSIKYGANCSRYRAQDLQKVDCHEADLFHNASVSVEEAKYQLEQAKTVVETNRTKAANKVTRLERLINQERITNERVRDYDHALVIEAAWNQWAKEYNLDPNICPRYGCGNLFGNVLWSLGAGALNALYLIVKLDDDFNMKYRQSDKALGYSREEFLLMVAIAYNSGPWGPVQDMKPDPNDKIGFERMQKFLENIKMRGAAGRQGWGQTVCYTSNMDACMRPHNMRPVTGERPTGNGILCGRKVGEDLINCQ